MSRWSLSAVSSIHRTGKSITIANSASSAISSAPATFMRRGMSALLDSVEVAQIELRQDRHHDHHQDPVGGRAPGVEAEERDLVDLERQRLRRRARPPSG